MKQSYCKYNWLLSDDSTLAGNETFSIQKSSYKLTKIMKDFATQNDVFFTGEISTDFASNA